MFLSIAILKLGIEENILLGVLKNTLKIHHLSSGFLSSQSNDGLLFVVFSMFFFSLCILSRNLVHIICLMCRVLICKLWTFCLQTREAGIGLRVKSSLWISVSQLRRSLQSNTHNIELHRYICYMCIISVMSSVNCFVDQLD